jgi:hypothetical protein
LTERIDLNALDTVAGAERGYPLELKTPDGRALPGHVRVRGYDSPTYTQLLDEQNQRRMHRMAMTKTTPTQQELKADEQEAEAALVAGWTVPFNLDGQPFEYTPANAQLLLKRWPWIRDAVVRAAGVRANFLPGSSAS